MLHDTVHLTYPISLYFAKEGAWIKDLEVLACDLEDNDIINGMDTITRGDLAITNKNGETWFSFRIPPQEHIEFEYTTLMYQKSLP